MFADEPWREGTELAAIAFPDATYFYTPGRYTVGIRNMGVRCGRIFGFGDASEFLGGLFPVVGDGSVGRISNQYQTKCFCGSVGKCV